jgi:hypothetical protein
MHPSIDPVSVRPRRPTPAIAQIRIGMITYVYS